MARVSGSLDEQRLLEILSVFMVLMGALSFLLLRFIQVPYGRYSSSTFGPPVPVRVAWFVQELPSFAVPVYHLIVYTETAGASLVLLGAFICHYAQRTLVFPFLIRGGKPTPLASFCLALIFCCYNGYLQSSYLCKYASLPPDWTHEPRFIIGMALFICGMFVNIHSDYILRNLRRPGEEGYKIPRGGLFEYVSGANFLGEIVEWSGFAIAGWSIPGAAFAVFTFLVLLSRAQQHHQWYIEKFEDYPKGRKILIPFTY
ncbi:3-oxo-5-alpha-steroid 4-dehydrogenase 1 [Anomaloglossus baeobatrachus]|uniref:3-oxo-5-alpha-steroid 4-dehydrogenase 1 n=1 Tax=Anomaloglossus baeobatrachus TaxID=238106 RepID=UPI003F4F758F